MYVIKTPPKGILYMPHSADVHGYVCTWNNILLKFADYPGFDLIIEAKLNDAEMKLLNLQAWVILLRINIDVVIQFCISNWVSFMYKLFQY